MTKSGRPAGRDDAFLPYPPAHVAFAAEGLLSGTRLAVKDIFDVAGYPTGAGNAMVLAASGTKTVSAPVVQNLLDAGAEFVGKTYTDELAYSVLGRNLHFGASVNPTFPDTITGGSSSGSAIAVAGGLAEIGLGSDTSGSIRIPAALTGTIGWRPTHGILSLAGCRPLAPSFDTAAFLVHDLVLLDRLMAVCGFPDVAASDDMLLVADELLDACDAEVADMFFDTLTQARVKWSRVKILGGVRLADLSEAFQTILWSEAWSSNAELLAQRPDAIDSSIRARLERGKAVSAVQVSKARQLQEYFKSAMARRMSLGQVICFPTIPSTPPGPAASAVDYDLFRQRALSLTCVAGLAGLPQVAIPASQDFPTGSLSLIARPLGDRFLPSLAGALAASPL